MVAAFGAQHRQLRLGNGGTWLKQKLLTRLGPTITSMTLEKLGLIQALFKLLIVIAASALRYV